MLEEGLLTLLRYWDWSLSLHQALWAEGGVSGWREPAQVARDLEMRFHFRGAP